MSVGPSAGKAGEKLISIVLSPLAKGAGIAASDLFKLVASGWSQLDQKQAQKRYVNYLSSLESRGLITKQGRGMASVVAITPKGADKLHDLNFSSLSLSKGEKWDGNWRLVSFDIPEANRTARAALRRLLKELGCVNLHDSVWIHPLDFRPQIEAIQKLYGIKKHISYFTVLDFDQSEPYKKIYRNVIIL